MIFFPKQPDFAGVVGQQVFARETHRHGKALSAFAYQHYVAGVLHHSLRYHRDILDVADAADRTGAAGGTVHATGIEFNDAFFVGKTAESHTGVVRIVFRAFDDADGGVERVASVLQEGEGIVEIVDAVVGADNDRA